MDTPSLIFYEHDFQDSQVTILTKSVLNLGNECRALAQENTRLKAEVESLYRCGDAMAEEIIGCYRAEGYDPADSETLPKWNAAKEGKPSV